MSDSAWQQANDAYLAAALSWLRLRLRQFGEAQQAASDPAAPPPPPQPATTPEPLPPAREGLWSFGRRRLPAAEPEADQTPEQVPRALPAPSPTIADDEVAQARATMLAAAEHSDPPPALEMLTKRLGLSQFERDLLLLCAAMELDTGTAARCAAAQGDATRAYPTFALALALFEQPVWGALAPGRPLRYWRLLEISQPGWQPLTASPLRADERIVSYIKGLNYLDDRLAPLIAPVPWPLEPTALPPSQQAQADRVAYLLKQQPPDRRAPVVLLLGDDTPSKQGVAQAVAASFGLHLYRLPPEQMPSQPADLETLARLWERESMLLPLALFLEAPPAEPGAQAAAQLGLRRLVYPGDSLVFIDGRSRLAGLDDNTVTVEVARPTVQEQRAAWAVALGDEAGDSPATLAAQFDLNLPLLRRVAQAALAEGLRGEALAQGLWDACRIETRPPVDTLARRIDTKATWDDLVLPPEQSALLHEIAAQVRQRGTVYGEWGWAERMNRGLGISALFTGESGTGKTMAAEVIANALRLDLYRIDLASVVSKYIGETEKNLSRVFSALEGSGAILFFDEADALFGKRSEVKDSHDRYANIEINYLLQRMEAYRGLAILATNLKSALDTAFLRRLRFVVNFPFPGDEQRRQIWEKAFPPQTPLEALDYGRLARLNLTGGNIHTVAINAAFLAASAGQKVTTELVLRAARVEYRKLERAINEREFAL
jgi:hypothetical protein